MVLYLRTLPKTVGAVRHKEKTPAEEVCEFNFGFVNLCVFGYRGFYFGSTRTIK